MVETKGMKQELSVSELRRISDLQFAATKGLPPESCLMNWAADEIERLQREVDSYKRLAWMIEMSAGPRPLWFDGQEFTADPNKGLRFYTREVAKELFDYLHRNRRIKLGYDCYAITEHAW